MQGEPMQSSTSHTGWPKTSWGKAQFGRRKIPALAVAIPTGILLAAGFAALTVWAGLGGDRPLLGGLVFGFAVVFPAIALSYAVVVDRTTIARAAEKPEESIEYDWFQRATSGALIDLVALCGILLLASVFFGPVTVELWILLTGVLVFALVSTGARYLLARRAG